MNHWQVTYTNSKQDTDTLIAMLASIGFDGFEEKEEELLAYIDEASFNEPNLKQQLNAIDPNYHLQLIPQQNWNELWEQNFSPVIVDDFVAVRAHFHRPIDSVLHEIIITPKMSFGTGHHATTFMVMQLMRELNFIKKTVFDFGTGTGILAILAEKLFATKVLAIDYDDWCIENATENMATNNCKNIELVKADNANVDAVFDIVIANINKNIIQDNFAALDKACKQTAQIILSGLLIEDEQDILKLATQYNWQHTKTTTQGAWIAMMFYVETAYT